MNRTQLTALYPDNSSGEISAADIRQLVTDVALQVQDADMDMDSHKITNVATPTLDGDAANKNYVDTAVSGVSESDPVWTADKPSYAAALNAASASTDGYLDKDDWITFNNKQDGLSAATAANDGYLDKDDWSTFNGKQDALAAADASHDGYLTQGDWSTFNSKEPAITKGSLSGSGPISVTASQQVIGTGATISIAQATASVDGYLSKEDWAVFNSKMTDTSVVVTATTTDATATTLAWTGSTIAQNSITQIRCEIVGIKSDGTQAASYTIWGTYRKVEGNALAVGGLDVIQNEDDATWDGTLVISTTTVLPQVTGKAATTIKWKATIYTQVQATT